jgi:tripartite ATP-independent transporter DctM subunit
MDPLILLMTSFFVMAFLKVPVAFALGLSSMLTLWQLELPFISVINQMYASVNSFPLLAVPLFLLLGRLMGDGGITDRFVNFSDALVGHIRGGLGHVNVVVAMLMAGISGSAAADTAAVGGILIPAMKKAKYDTPFTVALTASASTLGVIIPPSIMMVIYGAVGQVSIGALFLSGFVPGIMIGLAHMAYTYYIACKHGYPANPRKSIGEMGRAFVKVFYPLLLPVIILGGILSGMFTATEAAGVAVVYGLILMVPFYRSLKISELPQIFADSVVAFSLPMLAVASAGIMGWLIGYLGAPEMIAEYILGITTSPLGIYLMLVMFLLIIGTFLSPITAIIIFLPIIQKLGEVAQFDPIHLGIIVVLTLALGMITPPYGICLMISAQIGEIPTPKAFMAAIPMVGLTLLIILAGILIPDLFLFLPRTFMPQ